MTSRQREGEYMVGRIQPGDRLRPRKTGKYGVIKGEVAEQDDHLEWSHICEGALKTSKWFAYRIGPGDNGKGTRTDLLKAFDTKREAIDWLERRYGSKFDETF
jgi:hypothetical protein